MGQARYRMLDTIREYAAVSPSTSAAGMSSSAHTCSAISSDQPVKMASRRNSARSGSVSSS